MEDSNKIYRIKNIVKKMETDNKSRLHYSLLKVYKYVKFDFLLREKLISDRDSLLKIGTNFSDINNNSLKLLN